MNIAMTKMSSRGQIVLPLGIRGELKEGDSLIILKEHDGWIIKKEADISKKMLEDIEFARETEKSYQNYLKQPKRNLTKEQFLDEMKKW